MDSKKRSQKICVICHTWWWEIPVRGDFLPGWWLLGMRRRFCGLLLLLLHSSVHPVGFEELIVLLQHLTFLLITRQPSQAWWQVLWKSRRKIKKMVRKISSSWNLMWPSIFAVFHDNTSLKTVEWFAQAIQSEIKVRQNRCCKNAKKIWI